MQWSLAPKYFSAHKQTFRHFKFLLHCNNFDASSAGSILLHAGDLQHLSWLGLQWTLMGQRAALRDWLQQLFPRLTLETSKLDTNAPESICLLDLEVGGSMWAALVGPHNTT